MQTAFYSLSRRTLGLGFLTALGLGFLTALRCFPGFRWCSRLPSAVVTRWTRRRRRGGRRNTPQQAPATLLRSSTSCLTEVRDQYKPKCGRSLLFFATETGSTWRNWCLGLYWKHCFLGPLSHVACWVVSLKSDVYAEMLWEKNSLKNIVEVVQQNMASRFFFLT
jgi:hypothetical protein